MPAVLMVMESTGFTVRIALVLSALVVASTQVAAAQVAAAQVAAAQVAPAQSPHVGASWIFPPDGEYLLLEAREVVAWQKDSVHVDAEYVDTQYVDTQYVDAEPGNAPGNAVPGGRTFRGQDARIETPLYRTWRLFGDGRLAIHVSHGPSDELRLDPRVVRQLLISVDQMLDLAAAQTTAPPPQHGAFVALHLDHYHTADWQVAVDFLDAVATAGLAPIFEELAAVRQWWAQTHREGSWISFNPHPRICRLDHRQVYGLSGPLPVWCDALMATATAGPFTDGDQQTRERVRERLRERLRNLPRGLSTDPEPAPQEKQPQEDPPQEKQ